MTTTFPKTKRFKILNVNGTDQLFQVPDDYLQNTLWTSIQTGSESTYVDNIYFSGGYFQLATPPVAGSNIYCEYDVNVVIPDDPSNFDIQGVTIENILDIINVIKSMQVTMASMENAIDNRVAILTFTQFTDQLSARLAQIEAKLAWYHAP